MENRLLQAKATLPQYDRGSLQARIVHLGFGAFHRAHQAVYADILAAEHGSDWGYTEVNLIGGEQQIADPAETDGACVVQPRLDQEVQAPCAHPRTRGFRTPGGRRRGVPRAPRRRPRRSLLGTVGPGLWRRRPGPARRRGKLRVLCAHGRLT